MQSNGVFTSGSVPKNKNKLTNSVPRKMISWLDKNLVCSALSS